MRVNETADGRSRILQAALEIFARKGFDGARIDEIAKTAGVPKSLIYYHFKSKDEILSVLTQQFTDEYAGLIGASKNDTQREKARRLEQRLTERYGIFEREHADLIRVMFLESLKKDGGKPVLFEVAQPLVQGMQEAAARHGEPFDAQQELMAEFFTRMIPAYAYICFADEWAASFGVKREELDRLFARLLAETHGAYHINHSTTGKEGELNGNDHDAENSRGPRGAA